MDNYDYKRFRVAVDKESVGRIMFLVDGAGNVGTGK